MGQVSTVLNRRNTPSSRKPRLIGVARVADNVYVRRFQRSISGGVDSKKERLKDVRYQEFKEVGPDCVE